MPDVPAEAQNRLATMLKAPAFKGAKTAKAAAVIANYMAGNTTHYAEIAKNEGFDAMSRNVVADIYNDNIDGYAKVALDDVGDNLLALLPIIIIIALIPFVAYMVTDAFNITLPSQWLGGLQASDVWVTSSLLIGSIITIYLVSLIIVAVRKFRGGKRE